MSNTLNKYRAPSLLTLIVVLAVSTFSFGWSGEPWGSMSRDEIVAIADGMIDVAWSPLNSIYNFRSPSGGYTWFYSTSTYYGVAYMMSNPIDDLAEFLAHVNTTAGGTTYYGNDCSGFVSICWKMTTRHTTSTIEGATSYVTLLGSDGQCDDVQLIIGDACNNNGSHIILFDYYSGSGGMYSMEQTPTTATRKYWSWSSLANYRPLRRKDIVAPIDYGTYDGPSACSMNSNRIDIASRAISSGNVILRTWTSSNGWSTTNLGGYITDSPAIVSRADGILDIFCRSSDSYMYQNHYENGSWSGWQNTYQTLASGPSACSQNSNSITVCARNGGNNYVYVRNWTTSNGWGSWVCLYGTTYDSPAVVSRADEVLEVFVRGPDNKLYQQSSYDGGSTWAAGWYNHNFVIGSAPAVTSRHSGNIELFYRATNGNLWDYHWDSSTGWAFANHYGQMAGVPAVCNRTSDSLDVFVRGTDNNLYQLGWTGSGGWWTGFYNMGTY